ncbi:MAG: GMC family oxidoreductase [Balneola sp.]|jgi:choline dehydrogenase-like flavoprotein|nr:GMC family oxidoreductase [Balneola sp.]MBE80744.1 GMC family oxidoreductase [Balneola sp.]|tara:strand:+ start:23205 stop:24914 length:1710 start_codon:yes stop_codon:yes gene_type:complete
MANVNIKSKKERTYDAIVIGSGASGGWAAKELCDAGLKTLCLDRGRNVKHIEDYPTASKAPWEFEFRGSVPLEKRSGLQGGRWLRAQTIHWAMAEDEQPVIYEKPFSWFRGYHVGGKSKLWARQTQRWSDYDFEGPARDGFAVDWPIRYKDLDDWYTYVEKFAGISGDKDGLDVLPDGDFLPSFELNVVEKHFKESLKKHYGDSRHLIYARCAHLTRPKEIHGQQGRGQCMSQDMCNRGCNLGGYFSSNSSTIPWALRTGNLTMRPDAVVESVIYDEDKGKATGVRIFDRNTKEAIEYYADIIFVNASTINSNAILLNSRSNRFPNGLGNDNELMGKYLTWHNYRGHAGASVEGFEHKKEAGRRPTNAYVPRFRNVEKQETDFLRGYAIGFVAGRGSWSDKSKIGSELTESILNPKLNDTWHVSTWMMGECVPYEDNHMRLHESLEDKYGIPQIVLSCEWKENDIKQADDYVEQSKEMFEKAGYVNIRASNRDTKPGSDIHEMGGVRMGNDPKTSLLNKWNQLHECKNVFVTDGACMTSGGTQNPTLHFMALTARAANYAVEEKKKGNL